MIVSSATANPVLTATLSKYFRDAAGLVGRRIAPIFSTTQQSAKYYVFDKDNALQIPSRLERAPSTPYPRTKMKLSDDSYNCVNRGIEIPVDDEERSKYQSAFAADDAAMVRARNIVLINHEKRVRDAAIGSSVSKTTLSGDGDGVTNKWKKSTGVSGGDPVGAVQAAKDTIWTATGIEANCMILPRSVYNWLKEHSSIIDKIKYSQRGVVTVDILRQIFDIPEILIAGSAENSANDGQTIAAGAIWSDDVILLHREESPDLQAPNFMRTFVWTAFTGPDGVMVESYREDNIQSDVHRAKQHTDEKIVGAEFAFHIEDTL